jgi:hypothetical protein
MFAAALAASENLLVHATDSGEHADSATDVVNFWKEPLKKILCGRCVMEILDQSRVGLKTHADTDLVFTLLFHA